MDQEALESASPDPVKPRTGSTRGFVFADLRGPDPKFSFVEAHRTRFGTDAGEWSAGAYACIEIFFEALRATASPAFTSAQLREAARRYAVDTNRRYETVVGNIGFDENATTCASSWASTVSTRQLPASPATGHWSRSRTTDRRRSADGEAGAQRSGQRGISGPRHQPTKTMAPATKTEMTVISII